MSPRLARLSLAVAVSALACDIFAQPAQTPLPTNPPQQPPAPGTPPPPPAPGGPLPTTPSVAPAPPEDELVQLKLPDADIDTVLSALEIYTGRIILRPQQLQTATYNLKITKPIPKAEAILAIETVLSLNNIGVAPLGDKFLKVHNLNQIAKEAPEMLSGSAFERPASGKVATKLFQLEFMRVQEFVPMLQASILNPFYGGPMQLVNANAVLITDSISNLQRVELLLQQLDRPITAGMKPKFYTLKNGAKASDVVNKLRTILTGTLQQQLGSATSYSADDRTNQIIIVTDPRQWDFFTELIEKLDQRSDPNTRTEVLYLKHAKAKDVVDVLSRIISGQTSALQRQNQGGGSVRPGQGGPQQQPGQPPQPAQPQISSASAANNPNIDGMGSSMEFSALMTVVNDERSNAVVVFGTTDDIRLVRDLVDKLDIVLAQVRIEVVMAEVTLDDTDATGISALGLKVDGDKLVGFSGSVKGVGESLPFSIPTATISRAAGVSGPWDLAAEISIGTSPRKRNNSIITVPAVVTSHGKKATFFNGETRPVVTGTIQSAAGVSTGLASSSSVTQQEIGTRLIVTPFIGADHSVQLELTTEVQDVIGEVFVDDNTQYIIGKRNAESYITAKTGDIIVLGGFRKNSKTNERSRLGPIPIIGDLLGARTKSDNRQELVVFIRPIVLTNKPEIDNADMEKRIQNWSTREQLKKEIDPSYVPPKESLLDKILPK